MVSTAEFLVLSTEDIQEIGIYILFFCEVQKR